ncbi:hypothetical protein ACDA63_14385 [Uliginosibacterium sp. sgz301328]|uniref:hypothetical protein n=1 Tax=Uliginosibacterium sp. sgz301328 TaxID=3243764 RepID=UPI00359D4E09
MLTDSFLKDRILEAKRKSLAWVTTMQAPGLPDGVSRVSAVHDAAMWQQMLLPGTYDSIMLRQLLGDALPQSSALAEWILGARTKEGFFVLPGLDWAQTYKRPSFAETQQYMHFHTTNYALGALDALGVVDHVDLPFVTPFMDAQYLWAWLGRRDMRDPWLEGNNIVNLGSFLLLLHRRDPSGPAMQRLRDMVDWHNQQSEPYSGFWGPGQQFSQEALLFALCGATHNLHVFYALDEDIPHFNQSISRCLEQPIAVRSACIDVDVIDILAHGAKRCPHRREEIEHWLRTMAVKLLDFQNTDGGFPDTLTGERGYDGWVNGYKEPQGHSNTFATWFRWVSLAMISEVLWPGWQPWHFRRTIGIGYFRDGSAV